MNVSSPSRALYCLKYLSISPQTQYILSKSNLSSNLTSLTFCRDLTLTSILFMVVRCSVNFFKVSPMIILVTVISWMKEFESPLNYNSWREPSSIISMGWPVTTRTRWNCGFLFFGNPSTFKTKWIFSGFFLSSLIETSLMTYLGPLMVSLEKIKQRSLLNSMSNIFLEVTILNPKVILMLVFLSKSASNFTLFNSYFEF